MNFFTMVFFFLKRSIKQQISHPRFRFNHFYFPSFSINLVNVIGTSVSNNTNYLVGQKNQTEQFILVQRGRSERLPIEN